MCGITGIISLNGSPVDLPVLQRMNDLQKHRGPDGEGFVLGRIESASFKHEFVRHTQFIRSSSAIRVGLGHRRLAILDLSDGGLQPMSAKNGETWIIFNGEIYNYAELRTELESTGCVFNTRTDTEVLLQAYVHWGEDCLRKLEGMFAFAIWDSLRGRLFCARDRLGIKPFYYATPKGYFVFGSEIKSLLVFPGLETSLDDEAILGFLFHGNCDDGENTTLKSVKALAPAHCLTVDIATGDVAPRRYWQLEPRADDHNTDEQRIAELRRLLIATVGRHLNSDVRAGSCLSGGLDSSTIVALVGKIWREQPQLATAIGDEFYTFTSCYEYRELDERSYALAAANSAGASAKLVFPSPDDFWSDFERMAWHEDMPFSGLSFYSQWRVMRAAKETGVKVLLDGQGGDEVFGGYAKFRYAYIASLLRSGHLAGAFSELGAMLRQGDRYVLDLRNGFRYLPGAFRGLLHLDSLLKDALRPHWNGLVGAKTTPAARWWRNASGARNGDCPWTAMQSIQVDDILVDTLPTLLRMEDRSSMAFSIEARVPLLDHPVVEYGLGLPDHLKVQKGWSKFAIRQAMRGLLPESVRMRTSKLGFVAPDRYWPARDLRGQMTDLIDSDLRCRKYVDVEVVRRWYKSAQAIKANKESYLGLFRILSLEMWMRAFNLS